MPERRYLTCPQCGGTGNCFHPRSNGYCPVCRGRKRLTRTEYERYSAIRPAITEADYWKPEVYTAMRIAQ